MVEEQNIYGVLWKLDTEEGMKANLYSIRCINMFFFHSWTTWFNNLKYFGGITVRVFYNCFSMHSMTNRNSTSVNNGNASAGGSVMKWRLSRHSCRRSLSGEGSVSRRSSHLPLCVTLWCVIASRIIGSVGGNTKRGYWRQNDGKGKTMKPEDDIQTQCTGVTWYDAGSQLRECCNPGIWSDVWLLRMQQSV